jgi:hypothetical protein
MSIKIIRYSIAVLWCCCFFLLKDTTAQEVWHGKEREVHYQPEGTDLVKVSGKFRFNRALYGGNSGFRIEAGDLPEFALYMPGMGGNLKLEIKVNGKSKLLTDADSIRTIYRAGRMMYTIKDAIMGDGELALSVMALYRSEGIIIKATTKGLPVGTALNVLYGGASGKRFNRDGDIGADPESSFYLHPENCTGNLYTIDKNICNLKFAVKKDAKEIKVILPGDASWTGMFFAADQPYVKGSIPLGNNRSTYILLENTATGKHNDYDALQQVFDEAEADRMKLVGRVVLNTPDSFVNALGGILAVAADAIYEAPTFLHGAVAWRMRLNAWRGAYAADPLGWHDRARSHFDSYGQSQVTEPLSGPVVADTALGMARQLEKMGTSMFSSGYICRNPNGDFRPHHYDMNLVFIDQLLNHFQWTGDTAYVREMWPLIKRHLAWEKRNFDADNDGLYDAYACIWASDALQYNGGAVTHSSAYNYRTNKTATLLATLLKEDARPFEAEAEKIHNAIRLALWLPHLGSFAEYRDNLGLRNVHPAAGLWTIYHAMDAAVPDALQAYQSLQYVDRVIPHIPVTAKGMKDQGYVLASTDWQPYTWSVNNVALAENLHTALAYWQGNRNESAWTLWKSALYESMCLGTSPGNFEQLSFYDAARSELYRDFADPVGMASRSLVEGLFGIRPDALKDTLNIQPGFPAAWNYAGIEVPDIKIQFDRDGNKDEYTIQPAFAKKMNLKLSLPARAAGIQSVTLNKKPVAFRFEAAVGGPVLVLELGKAPRYDVRITWTNRALAKINFDSVVRHGTAYTIKTQDAQIEAVYDPQEIFSQPVKANKSFSGRVQKEKGWGTFFVQLRQDQLTWWQPVDFTITALKPAWPLELKVQAARTVNIDAAFNDKVTRLFEQRYESPRWPYPTLQLPVQGIGNWCYPKIKPGINDSGLRNAAKKEGQVTVAGALKFRTPWDTAQDNILLTSLWDNYPDSAAVVLNGKGRYLALLLCGTTNPMQSQLENGKIVVHYSDGTDTALSLRNPDNWWPVEQDYRDDGYAFRLNSPPPLRLHLQDGKVYPGIAADSEYSNLKGYSDRMIAGGAATILYMPLDPEKILSSLTLKATANEVVIGLMGISIVEKAEEQVTSVNTIIRR